MRKTKAVNLIEKAISLFTVLGVLVCSILSAANVFAAEEVNFARNPGFERGSSHEAESWGVWPSWGNGEHLETQNTHSGNRAVKFELSNNQNYALFAGGYRTDDFDLKRAFTLKMWVNYTDLSGGFTIGLERKNNDVAVANAFSSAFTGSSNGWKQISFDVPATDKTLSENIIKVEVLKGSGTLIIDDVVLCEKTGDSVDDGSQDTEKELLLNCDFKNGSVSEASAWGLTSGWNSSRFSTESESDTRSVKLELTSSVVNLFQSSAWNSEKYDTASAKVFSANVKYTDVTGGGFYLRVERKSAGQGVADVASTPITGSSEGFIAIELNVPKTEYKIDELIVSIVCENGTGTLVIDRVSLKEKIETEPGEEPENPPENPPEQDDNNPNGESEKNLILNESFEEGGANEASAWGLTSGWKASSFSATAEDGTRSVSLPTNGREVNLFQSSAWNSEKYTLSTGKTVTAYVKLNGVVGNGVWLRVERKAGGSNIADMVSSYQSGTTNGFEEIKLSIPNIDNTVDELVVSVVANATAGEILVDSVKMVEGAEQEEGGSGDMPPQTDDGKTENGSDTGNFAQNGSFESGNGNEASAWGLSSGWSSDNLSDFAHTGSKSVKVALGKTEQNLFQSSIWNTEKYNLNSSKLLTAWVNFENVHGGVYLRIERKYKDVTILNTESKMLSDANGWQKLSLVDLGTQKDVDELIISVVIGAGSGNVYIDDVTFEDYTPTSSEIKNIADTVDKNLLMNGGFERGTDAEINGWGIGNGWKKEYISNASHSGGRAVKINLSSSSINLFQSSAWNTNKYSLTSAKRITVWVNYENVTGTGIFLLAERKYKDQVIATSSSVAVNGTSNGWTQLALISPGVKDQVEELVISVAAANGSGTVYIDDAYMEDYFGAIPDAAAAVADDNALLRNGGLEQLNADGSVFAWDVWPGDPAEGERFASISTAEKHSGNQALKISLTPKNVQAVYQYNLRADHRFDFQEAYVFSAWIKCVDLVTDITENTRIGVKRRGTDGNYYNAYADIDTKISGWQNVKIIVPKALVEIDQYDVIVEIGAGTGDIYLDDFVLVPATAEDLASLNGNSEEKLLVKVSSMGKSEIPIESTTDNGNTILLTASILAAVISVSAAIFAGIKLKKSL